MNTFQQFKRYPGNARWSVVVAISPLSNQKGNRGIQTVLHVSHLLCVTFEHSSLFQNNL